jgi:putative ABC transport system permease protein
VTAPWRKVVRDVWRERTRAALVVLAIAIGLAGFLAVLSTYAILRRELNQGYLATNPASAVLLMDAVDDELLASIVARADVGDADARRVLTGRIRTGSSEWRRLIIFVVRDFQNLRISTVRPDAGAWPPAAGDLLVERDAFQVARAGIGDVVTIETTAGLERTLRVAGRVHDAGQAQARMENLVYGYITPETLAALGETPVLDRLYVLASGDRFDEAHVRRVAGNIRAWLEGSGHAVHRMDVPTPGQHPHAGIMGVLLLAMAAFGLFALVLSGVIVANLLLAMMAAERRQIGVMKAVGGTRGQIARIYLAEAALFGVAAIALAIPAGVAGGRGLSREFALLLNFDLASLAVPAWVYLLVAVVGLLVPLAAAGWPVSSGTAVTVREALAAAGVSQATFGSSRLDRRLCGVGAAGRPWLLGVRNCLRRRTRTALTLATLSIAGAFFISALSLRASMMATLDRLFGAGTYGATDRYAFDQHMLMIYVFLVVVSGVLAAIGGLGLMTATSLNVLDRRRELGVLRAIGASPAMVGGIVVVEAVFVAVISWVLAVPAAWAITTGVGRLVTAALFPGGLDVIVPAPGVLGWLGIATTLSAVSSLAPAVGASRRPVREAVSYE